MSKTVKMYAPGNKPLLLASVNGGHTISVNPFPEGSDVPPEFQKLAIEKQCVLEGMEHLLKESEKQERREPTRIEVVIKGIEELMARVDANPEKKAELMTGDGRPDVNALKMALGMPVSAAERDEAWEVFLAGGDD